MVRNSSRDRILSWYTVKPISMNANIQAIAVAGPTWTRLPNPLVAETAPLVVALKVTESMETPDLAPTRLERAREEAHKLVEQMDDRCWWIGIDVEGGGYWAGNFYADSRGRMTFGVQEMDGFEWDEEASHE